MRADKPYSAELFPGKLHKLRARRKNKIKIWRDERPPRASLSSASRQKVLEKTDRRCHICGGKIVGDDWQVDHLVAYARKGTQSLKNCLPAHSLCNGYRRCFSEVEFQFILKLGVWLRTEIANRTKLGRDANEKFCQKEQLLTRRRKS